MFTKYHNFFLSNRFLKIFRFKTNSQTKPIRIQISLPCMSCRSFVGLCINSFIPSFMHPCIHLFKSLTTLHFKFLCQKFLQHNVVASLDQHSWLQFSDNSFYFNTLLKTILVIWLCWWSYCRRWASPLLSLPLFLSSLFISFWGLIMQKPSACLITGILKGLLNE